MIYYARKCGWPVVDATKAVVIAHQDHDYSHLPGGRRITTRKIRAKPVLRGKAGMFLLIDADARLEGGRVRPFPPSLARLLRKWSWPPSPQHPRPAGLRRVLVRWLRRHGAGLTGCKTRPGTPAQSRSPLSRMKTKNPPEN